MIKKTQPNYNEQVRILKLLDDAAGIEAHYHGQSDNCDEDCPGHPANIEANELYAQEELTSLGIDWKNDTDKLRVSVSQQIRASQASQPFVLSFPRKLEIKSPVSQSKSGLFSRLQNGANKITNEVRTFFERYSKP